MTRPSRITAVVACHNRRVTTTDALDRLFSQALPPDWDLGAVVVDDGSTDGSAGAIEALPYDIKVIRGSGDLFWTRGMELAARSVPDETSLLLLLNDDVQLQEGALLSMLSTLARRDSDWVVVGALIDPASGCLTYSGLRRLSPLLPSFRPVSPSDPDRTCESFNGNLVLMSRHTYESVGGLDSAYDHGMGDIDLGFRLYRKGVHIELVDSPLGYCSRNPSEGSWRDPTLGIRTRWSLLLGRKGYPPKARLRFLRRTGSPFWLAMWLRPYLGFWLTAPLQAIAEKARGLTRHTSLERQR